MKTLRTIVAVVVVALTLVAAPVFADDPVDPQMAQQLAALGDQVRSALQGHFDLVAADIHAAAGAIAGKGLGSPEARQALKALCNKHISFVDCGTIDPRGVIVALEPARFHKYEGTDVSSHAPVAEVLSTKRSVVSDVFKAVEGFWAINFEFPIFAPGGEAPKKGKEAPRAYEGSISTIAKPSAFINYVVKPFYSQGVRDIWVMQMDGKVIASRDPDTIGDDFLPTTTSSSQTTLPQLLARIVKEPKGQGSYRLLTSGQGEARQVWCSWDTIGYTGDEFRVIVFTH